MDPPVKPGVTNERARLIRLTGYAATPVWPASQPSMARLRVMPQ